MNSALTMLGLALVCCVGNARAASTSVPLAVTIEVAPRCISAAWSAEANALVQVVCSTGQFVGIEPAPDKPFVGTHGAAFRYVVSPGGFVPPEVLLKTDLNGAITSLRVYNASWEHGPLEMLVSF